MRFRAPSTALETGLRLRTCKHDFINHMHSAIIVKSSVAIHYNSVRLKVIRNTFRMGEPGSEV